MALRFLDSFDHFSTAADKYTSGGGTPIAGRHGNGLDSQGCWMQIPDVAHSRLIIGGAWKVHLTDEFYRVSDGPWDIAFIGSGSDGKVGLQFGSGTVASAVGVLHEGSWHYIEVDLTIVNDGAGHHLASVAKILVDGAL